MLDIRNVTKTFNAGTANEVRSLQGISLNIYPGSFVTVIGTNGSGKSTLLNAIAGTFKLDKGQILIDNTDVTNWDEHKRAKYVGRVFQNPLSGTAPNLTIAENLSLAALRGQTRGLSKALKSEFRDIMISSVKSLGMGLEGRLDNIIGSLSGGQRQALTLLMATYLRPQVLLLDEHTAALDPKSADQVIKITDRVVTQNKLTTFMVTHSMQQAVTYGDRVIMLHRGKIAHDFRGKDKKRLRVDDFLSMFEEIRRADLLDETAAELLRKNYI